MLACLFQEDDFTKVLPQQSQVCLDPTIDVSCVNNRLFFNERKNKSLYKQYLRRRSPQLYHSNTALKQRRHRHLHMKV